MESSMCIYEHPTSVRCIQYDGTNEAEIKSMCHHFASSLDARFELRNGVYRYHYNPGAMSVKVEVGDFVVIELDGEIEITSSTAFHFMYLPHGYYRRLERGER